jgi:hypothetical protein
MPLDVLEILKKLPVPLHFSLPMRPASSLVPTYLSTAGVMRCALAKMLNTNDTSLQCATNTIFSNPQMLLNCIMICCAMLNF